MSHYATLAQAAQPQTAGVTVAPCVVSTTTTAPSWTATFLQAYGLAILAAVAAAATHYFYVRKEAPMLKGNPSRKKKGSRSVTMTVTQNATRKKRRKKKGWKAPSENVSTRIRGTGNSPTRTSTSTSGKDIGNSPTRTSTKAVTLTSTQS